MRENLKGCNLCSDDTAGVIHCWEYVRTRNGEVGWRGCHENFHGREAYSLHRANTGGCHHPPGVDNLRWSGVGWRVKPKDEEKRRD